MQRLACLLVIFAAACTDDGTGTGAAMLTYETPSVRSAYSKTFKGTDGTGTTVLGWKIEFTDAAPGTGCKSDSAAKVIASVGIFTSQTTGSFADLATGDISIVLDAPPTAPPMGAAANMGATGVSGIQGAVSITGVGKTADGKSVIRIEGSLAAGGSDGNGGPVQLMGTFDAPNCI
ncbi:MAG: hypothetical protein ACM31C_25490 [Acidobacteriota bacterium]